jgi:AraC-like DNA-binding protein
MNDQFTNTNAGAATFNLAEFEARDTATLEIQNIKDDGPLLVNGQPVRVEIRSPGTREALAAQHKLEAATTTRTFAQMRGKTVKETPESKRAERAEKLAAVTVRIENFPVAPQELYNNPKLGWFTDQVAAFHASWENF